MLQDNTLDQTDPRADSTGTAERSVSSHDTFLTFPFTISEPLKKKKKASKLPSQTTARLLRVLCGNSLKPKEPHVPQPMQD